MLKPDDTIAHKGKPRASAPRPAAAGPAQRCVLCGGPCAVVALSGDPAWEVQHCECSGPRRRRADLARGL